VVVTAAAAAPYILALSALLTATFHQRTLSLLSSDAYKQAAFFCYCPQSTFGLALSHYGTYLGVCPPGRWPTREGAVEASFLVVTHLLANLAGKDALLA